MKMIDNLGVSNLMVSWHFWIMYTSQYSDLSPGRHCLNHTNRFSNSGLFTRDWENRSIHEQSAPLNFIQPAVTVGVTRTPQVTIMELIGTS